MPSKASDPERAASRRAQAPAVSPVGPAGDTAATNATWSLALIDAMVAAGVREALVAPGSRNAPLTLALDRSGLRTHVAIDERAGAYFALGLARASRRPVIVLTTSGTAAANLHPAALEAFHGRVPLVLLTADRPPELRAVGAPQTIDQIRLFGTGVAWFAEAGLPEGGPTALKRAASLGAQAVAAAWGPPAGPAHLNVPFREPLLPEPVAFEAIAKARAINVSDGRGTEDIAPPSLAGASAASVRRVARALRGRRRGVIVCGPMESAPEFAPAVTRLADVTGYPILADPLSGLRFGAHDRSRVCGAYELFLRSPSFADAEAPEAVMLFGAVPTSKAWSLQATRAPAAYRVAVDEIGATRDPSRLTREILRGDPALTAAALADLLASTAEPDPTWADRFRRAERAAADAVSRHLASSPVLGEEHLFPTLLPVLADAARARRAETGILYVGNSMPIRDLDLTGAPAAWPIRVLGNRGVNGIDGVVSSALGASVGDAPLLVVVGDLSFHHDLNALAALREGRARATIVVVQNDGGGIFSFLPAARHTDAFERYFGTPHGLDIAKAAALYGVPHALCANAAELAAHASQSLRTRETVILEVRTDRAANFAAHQAMAEAARRAVEEAL